MHLRGVMRPERQRIHSMLNTDNGQAALAKRLQQADHSICLLCLLGILEKMSIS